MDLGFTAIGFTTVVWLIVGGIAGWMVGKILKRTFWGTIGDIVIGMVGGFAGAWLWAKFYPAAQLLDHVKEIAASAAGGVVLTVLWRVVRAMR